MSLLDDIRAQSDQFIFFLISMYRTYIYNASTTHFVCAWAGSSSNSASIKSTTSIPILKCVARICESRGAHTSGWCQDKTFNTAPGPYKTLQ